MPYKMVILGEMILDNCIIEDTIYFECVTSEQTIEGE